MSLDIARACVKEDSEIRAFMTEILAISPLRGEGWNVASPEITAMVWEKIVRVVGDENPLRDLKAKQNQKAFNLYPAAQDEVKKSQDPVLTAFRFAIAGNLTHPGDDGAVPHSSGDWPLMNEAALALKVRLQKTNLIVYLLDNCGEMVFDKLFLETIMETYDPEVWVIARGRPVLNDATTGDAISIGLQQVATVIGNGMARPYAGTRLELVSREVRNLLARADLIISKGGGNLQSLIGERELDVRIIP